MRKQDNTRGLSRPHCAGPMKSWSAVASTRCQGHLCKKKEMCCERCRCSALHVQAHTNSPASQQQQSRSTSRCSAAMQVQAHINSRAFREALAQREAGPARGIIINGGGRKMLSSVVVLLKVWT